MEEKNKKANLNTNNSNKKLYWQIALVFAIFIISLILYFAKKSSVYIILLVFILCVLRGFTNPLPEQKNLWKYIINTYLFLFGIAIVWNPPITGFYWFLCIWLCILLPFYDSCLLTPCDETQVQEESKPKYKNEKEKIIALNNIIVDRTIVVDRRNHILVDTHNKKIIFMNNIPTSWFDSGTLTYKILNFKDIYSFDLIEDGFSKLEGRGMVSVLGQIMFGIPGAIVGTVAGDRRSINCCTCMYINISINDVQNPLLTLVLLNGNGEIEKSSYAYKDALNTAQEILALLTYIKNNA